MAAQSPNSSFSAAPGVEEELQELRRRLGEEEASSRTLQERLQTSEQLLREKDQAHAEQVNPLCCLVLFVLRRRMWLLVCFMCVAWLLPLSAPSDADGGEREGRALSGPGPET